MTSLYRSETRHHPEGKTCHHFTYHGLTCDEYDAMRARANGHCEICGIAEEDTDRGSLVVDHFEKASVRVIRGLLCNWCNVSVMACIDGLKVWGTENRKWEAKAREYEANSWQRPSADALALMAARKEKMPKYAPRPRFDRGRALSITLPARKGVPAMAEALRKWLTPDELAELVALLASEQPDAS